MTNPDDRPHLPLVRAYCPARTDTSDPVLSLLAQLDQEHHLADITFAPWGGKPKDTVTDRWVAWCHDTPLGFLAGKIIRNGLDKGRPGRRCALLAGIARTYQHGGPCSSCRGITSALHETFRDYAKDNDALDIVLQVDTEPSGLKRRETSFRSHGFIKPDDGTWWWRTV